ncbi:hypothetical protein REPUB_Repub10bG0113400 [Reevesia pubescens]
MSKGWFVNNKLEVHELKRNIFLFVFKEERDKQKVNAQGPWMVMDCHLILKNRPDEATLEEIDFSTSKIWVQVHSLPMAFMTRSNVEKIASMFPKMLELDCDEGKVVMWNNVMRMKVLFRVDEPLKIGFYLKHKNKPATKIPFKYECLPDFCYHCGRLGHVAKD